MTDAADFTASYFVDEAGCFTLFNKRGTQVVGKPGVSRCLMVGAAFLPDPELASQKLESLREELLTDPYFRGVPSLDPTRRKTAICFHAKDDLPEVRREVFRLLPALTPKVQVAIRRKSNLAQIARYLGQKGEKLDANQVYDQMVSRLLRNSLHKPAEVHLTFARRGKSSRQAALRQAVERGRANFRKKWGVASNTPVRIHSAYPSESAGLQVIDYYLWALQRMYERGEDRYFAAVADQFRLIMDLDDTRHRPYGEWYSDSNPLSLDKIKPVTD